MLKLFIITPFIFSIILSNASAMESRNKYLKQFNHLVNVYQKCSAMRTTSEFHNCLKQRLIIALDDLSQYEGDIELISKYLVLVSDDSKEFQNEYAKGSKYNEELNSNFKTEENHIDNVTRKSTDGDGARNAVNANKTDSELLKDFILKRSFNNGALNISHHFAKLHKTDEKVEDELKNKNEAKKENKVGDGLLTASDHMERSAFSSPKSKDANLNHSLKKSLYRLTKNRSLLIKLPLNHLQYLEVGDGVQEARKKKDNGMVMMGCMMMGGTLLSLAFGSLAVLAGKALMTSMLALMLSLLAALSKKGGHHSGLTHAGTTYEVINVPSGSGRAYKKRHQVMTVFPQIVTADASSGWDGRSDVGTWESGASEM